MITVREGEKKDIAVKIERSRGSAAFTLTTPQRRILDASRVLVTGFDWAAASWDAATSELFALFDGTAAGLTAPGDYHMQLRGTIANELYAAEVKVVVVEWAP